MRIFKSLKAEITRVKMYKCPDCPAKFQRVGALFTHVEKYHEQNIPDDISVKRYVFNRRNKKEKGTCTVCGKESPWNEETGRYERYCSEKCKTIAGERAKENMRKKYGKDHLLDDPDYQKKMLKGRSISGTYKFKDEGSIDYVGSYELDFLQFCDETMNLKSTMITECPFVFRYNDGDKDRFYIPDFYIPSVNLIVEVKEGGSNPNTHPDYIKESKSKEKLKDAAIVAEESHNFIKVVDKDYSEFITLIKLLRDRSIESKKDRIPIVIL